jgi:hypothetical protein
MPYEDYKDLSELELIRRTWDSAITNPGAVSVDRLLKLRASLREAETADNMMKATKDLVTATKRLGTMTLWLVLATFLLVAAEIALKVMGVK